MKRQRSRCGTERAEVGLESLQDGGGRSGVFLGEQAVTQRHLDAQLAPALLASLEVTLEVRPDAAGNLVVGIGAKETHHRPVPNVVLGPVIGSAHARLLFR
jgi:hypothetical protein